MRPQRIIFADYRGACFDVTNLRFYGKGELAACTRDFKEILHLEVIAMGPEQHVGAIEVKIKQVNERIRCHWNTLPFKLSRQLLKYLVMFCISRVTMVVSSRWETGTTESPREMFTNRMLDYKRDLRDCFEDYQQAWTPNHKANSMHSRTNGCIALMPTGNVQGTVRCFQLHHGAIVNRDNFTIIPISDHVSAHLNDLAARDKRPIYPDAAIALGNLENVVNNDVPLREEAYLHPAIDVAREGATVQRADVTAATDLPHITTSVSKKKYMQQMDAGQQAEADVGLRQIRFLKTFAYRK